MTNLWLKKENSTLLEVADIELQFLLPVNPIKDCVFSTSLLCKLS